MDFKYLIIDSNNFGYHVMNFGCDRSITRVSKKFIYPTFVRKYMDEIELLVKTYDAQEVIFLFDNHTSKDELKQEFAFPQGATRKDIKETYKSNRKKETQEFYWSLDFLKYYYMISEPKYHTVQIFKLEADDLVAPCIKNIIKDDSALLVSNDSDWTRYVSEKIMTLPDIHGNPQDVTALQSKYGFYPTEDKIVLYKVLYGDSADDIPIVFPEIKPAIRERILKDFDSIFDLILYGFQKDYLKEFVPLIKDREMELKVNYQLISTIAVSDIQFMSHYSIGRGSEILKKTLRSIIYGGSESSVFEFGGLKTPRVEPKST